MDKILFELYQTIDYANFISSLLYGEEKTFKKRSKKYPEMKIIYERHIDFYKKELGVLDEKVLGLNEKNNARFRNDISNQSIIGDKDE